MQNQDRRRINPPAGGTRPPVFVSDSNEPHQHPSKRIRRTRKPDEHRKIFLRTGIVPSASGSAYYETSPHSPSPSSKAISSNASFTSQPGHLKLTCTIHGPRPLPRNSQYSPNLLLSTTVKFAPFATRRRRGWVRDASERDLGVHLETALRGVIVGERFPKAGVEVVVTVLEAEEDEAGTSVGAMAVLAGCVTVASAALVDAGIDCLDLVSGGVAAIAGPWSTKSPSGRHNVLDPSPSEHISSQPHNNDSEGDDSIEGNGGIQAACIVAYLQSRDEITELWMKGDVGEQGEELVDAAVKAAKMVRGVLAEASKEDIEVKAAKGEELEGVNGGIEDDGGDAGVKVSQEHEKAKGRIKAGQRADAVMTG